MKRFIFSALIASTALASAAAFAQTAPVAAPAPAPAAAAPAAAPVVPDHPRVNEVDQRLQHQQQRIDNGVTSGQIGAKQEMHDEKVDAHVSQELSKDEAKHNGHITKAEQKHMNRQLNHNSKRIHHQRVTAKAKAGATAQ